jgi:UDP-N-acetylmuramoyl-tripeptide--D-alanyl-D-alanine ligase
MENKVQEIYQLFLAHPFVSTDSRQVKPGSLFFALQGDSFNGNEFAIKALDAGAAWAIVDEPGYSTHPSCILVDDVLDMLQALAKHHRMQFDIPVIGITGTNGKTTTKELVYSVLSRKYNTLATAGNLNNHIGVPLTLLNISPSTGVAIVEMGANHPGEIDFLCNIAQPTYGLITNIGKAHLEGFGSYEGVVRTKTELYRFLHKRNGTAVIHRDDDVLMQHSSGLSAITYGSPPADLTLIKVNAGQLVSVTIQFIDGDQLDVDSKLYGRYNTDNVLAAACIGQYFNVPPPEIKAAIESYQPGNNRSQITETGTNMLIMDAYNANPSSMKAAIETFAHADYPDKTIILGDMLELGDVSDQEHLEVLNLIAQVGFKNIYLVGPIFTRLNTARENICFQDTSLAKMWMEHHKIENATVLIKGSRGIRLEKLVEVL